LIYENRQSSQPIKIGDYCFVSTQVVILGGSILPSYSVLGAGAVLSKSYQEEWKLYAGVPAKIVKEISKGKSKYFYRKKGFVY
jgi:acetyltransferase-like isoleucine patch superfamily enzyme